MIHKIAILYIGNKLSHLGFTPGGIETLGRQFEGAGFIVHYAGTDLPHLLAKLHFV